MFAPYFSKRLHQEKIERDRKQDERKNPREEKKISDVQRRRNKKDTESNPQFYRYQRFYFGEYTNSQYSINQKEFIFNHDTNFSSIEQYYT